MGSPITRYQEARLVARFEAYRQHPSQEGKPLSTMAEAWVTSLTPSQQRHGRGALKRALGPVVDWSAIRLTRQPRNFALLQASVLSESELEQLTRILRTNRERALVPLLFTLRRFEVCNLAWDAIDWRQGLVAVQHGKGDRNDWTLLTNDALGALRALHEERGRPASGLVFISYRGRGYTPRGLGWWLASLLTCAGIKRPERACHALRRTMATRYLRANPSDLDGLQKIMRHASVSTTCLYSYPQPADLAPRLARAFGGPATAPLTSSAVLAERVEPADETASIEHVGMI